MLKWILPIVTQGRTSPLRFSCSIPRDYVIFARFDSHIPPSCPVYGRITREGSEVDTIYKICAHCHEQKPIQEFLRRTGKRSGKASRRGACRSRRKRCKAVQVAVVSDAQGTPEQPRVMQASPHCFLMKAHWSHPRYGHAAQRLLLPPAGRSGCFRASADPRGLHSDARPNG